MAKVPPKKRGEKTTGPEPGHQGEAVSGYPVDKE
jgi:hypothetical protein